MLAPGALLPGRRGWSAGWRWPGAQPSILAARTWLAALAARPDGQTPADHARAEDAAALNLRGGLGASAIVERLYQEHAATVLAYLHARLPTMADAEDTLAEVYLAALRACDAAEPLSVGWLMTVARNRVADYYRRRARSARNGVQLELTDDAPMGEDADPEWLALRAEERRELLTLIRRLPEEQQDALALRFAAGMRCPEIARITGRNEDAVRKLLSRAVARLRREWAE
jgi:RNA polymerase sigma-70 factor (ECF subfamily)